MTIDATPRQPASAAKLGFEAVTHRFTPERATLRCVSLEARPGEVLCLLGPSGSGKTTLLRIAAGIESQTAGRVLLDDREIAGPAVFQPPERRPIGLVFQDFALFPHLSILENVRFGLAGLPRGDGRREAAEALARVGLSEHAARYPHILSGGEQQRVALARALAPRPAVILMDEPFSGLDARLKDAVRTETLAILRESRATAVIVTHDAEEAMRIGDRIALLRDGALVQAGTPEALYRTPANLFAAGFFSEINTFRARVHAGHAAAPIGRVAAPGLPDGTAVTVAVRLSGFEVDVDHGACAARVLSRRFLGEAELVEIALDGAQAPVRARVPAGRLPAGARDIRVTARPPDTLVFETEGESE